MEPWGTLVLSLVGCALAFPAAVLLCLPFGFLLARPERCARRGMREVRLFWMVRSRPPTPAFYRCAYCGIYLKRGAGRQWRESPGPEHDEEARGFWQHTDGGSQAHQPANRPACGPR